MGRAKVKAKGRAKGKVRAKRKVVQSRKATFALIRALDAPLRHRRGSGLSDCAGGLTEDLSSVGFLPTLSLSYDECSANLAMVGFLTDYLGLRILGIRDIFHNEWNDVCCASKSCGLRWAIGLTSIYPTGKRQG